MGKCTRHHPGRTKVSRVQAVQAVGLMSKVPDDGISGLLDTTKEIGDYFLPDLAASDYGKSDRTKMNHGRMQ